MTIKIYVPMDVAALACGADEVVLAIQTESLKRGLPVQIIRNGSRGMLWLEPLVEVETPQGRVAYGRSRRRMFLRCSTTAFMRARASTGSISA
jgi:formate dehydrogenase iron-sulfur subunit